jgi:hypothetical protein
MEDERARGSFPLSRRFMPAFLSVSRSADRSAAGVVNDSRRTENTSRSRFTLSIRPLASLSRTWNREHSPDGRPSMSEVNTAHYPGLATPAATYASQQLRGDIDMPENNEEHSGRHRRHRHRRRRHGSGHRHARTGSGSSRPLHSSRRTSTPRSFLVCVPWIKSQRMRAQVVKCFVSGLFMILTLTVCKLLPRDITIPCLLL